MQRAVLQRAYKTQQTNSMTKPRTWVYRLAADRSACAYNTAFSKTLSNYKFKNSAVWLSRSRSTTHNVNARRFQKLFQMTKTGTWVYCYCIITGQTCSLHTTHDSCKNIFKLQGLKVSCIVQRANSNLHQICKKRNEKIWDVGIVQCVPCSAQITRSTRTSRILYVAASFMPRTAWDCFQNLVE